MALNKLMHPRNPYKNKRPDFKALAIKYPEFRKYADTDLKGKVTLDFKQAECLRALSWALLKEDFGLDVDMLSDRLIPTIPLRMNYILWLEDLLPGKEQSTVHGIDIGCGATCVYALLGAKVNNWRFLTSETEPVNLEYARRNVAKNNMADKITIRAVEASSGLSDLIAFEDSQSQLQSDLNANEEVKQEKDQLEMKDEEREAKDTEQSSKTNQPNHPPSSSPQIYDFCMCNPPFFESDLEAWGQLTTRNADERLPPWSAKTGTKTECIVEGGEVQYVGCIIRDSLELRGRVRIYTTMLGKKSSLPVLKECLRDNGITNFGSTEFCQGHTMRWALGWSFDPTVTFPTPPSKVEKKNKCKGPMSMVLPSTVPDVNTGWARLKQMLLALQMEFSEKKNTPLRKRAIVTAATNTWSHQRRQRRKKQKDNPQGNDTQGHQDGKQQQQQQQQEGMKVETETTASKEIHGHERINKETPKEEIKRDSSREEINKDTAKNEITKETTKEIAKEEINRETERQLQDLQQQQKQQQHPNPSPEKATADNDSLDTKDGMRENGNDDEESGNGQINAEKNIESILSEQKNENEGDKNGTDEKIDGSSEKIDGTDKKIDRTDKKIDGTDKKIDGTSKKMDETEMEVEMQIHPDGKGDSSNKRKAQDSGGITVKRMKMESELADILGQNVVAKPVLEMEVVMKAVEKYIMLELQLWGEEGQEGNRETVHQVLQYIKNHWEEEKQE